MRIFTPAAILLALFNVVFGSVFLFEISQGDEKAYVRWHTAAREDGLFTLASVNELEKVKHHLISDAGYNTLEWSFEKVFENTNYTVKSKDGQLLFCGVVNGKLVDKSFDCGEKSWFQFHALSLPRYINAEHSKVNFVSVRPDDAKVFELKAEYKGIESVLVKGDSVKTMRIDVSLQGLLSRFGNVTYWFRIDDGVFVKFRGMSGLPGSTPVIYELIKMEG